MKDSQHALDMVARVNNAAIEIQKYSNNRSNEEVLRRFKHAIRLLFDAQLGFSDQGDMQSQVKSDDHQRNRDSSQLFLLSDISLPDGDVTESVANRHKEYSICVFYNVALVYYRHFRHKEGLQKARKMLSLCIDMIDQEHLNISSKLYFDNRYSRYAILVFHLLGCVHISTADVTQGSDTQANIFEGLYFFSKAYTLASSEYNQIHYVVHDTLSSVGWALIKANCITRAICVFEKACQIQNQLVVNKLTCNGEIESENMISPAA